MSKNNFLQAIFEEKDYFEWLSASFGVIFVVFFSIIFTLDGFKNSDKYLILLAVFLSAPLFSIFYYSKNFSFFTKAVRSRLLFSNLIFCFFAITAFGKIHFGPALPKINPILLFGIYCILTALLLNIKIFERQNYSFVTLGFNLVNTVLIFIIPVYMIAVLILPMDWMTPNYFILNAGKIGAVLAFLTILIWCLPSKSVKFGWVFNKYLGILVICAACFFPILLIDPGLNYDGLHYTAFLGPASAVNAGKIPLIDVFSQYGQSYLVYLFLMNFLPKTYHAAALVTAICNTINIILVIVILRKFIKNNIVFLILALSIPFFYWMVYHYNPNNTPSHGGLRYLPVYMVAASLIWMKIPKVFTGLSMLALFMALVWSFEAFIYSLFIYEVFILTRAGQNNLTLKFAIRESLVLNCKLVGIVTVFLVFISSFYLIFFESLPRYDLYLSLVMSYVGSDPFIDYSWYQEGFYSWVPIIVGYFVLICMITRQFLVNKDRWAPWIQEAAVLFSLGMAVGAYCLISTQPFIFKSILLPIYLFLYWGLNQVITSGYLNKFRVGFSIIGIGPIFIFLWFVLAGQSIGNFLDIPNPSTSPSILRDLLKNGSLNKDNLYKKVNSFCNDSSDALSGNICGHQDKRRGSIFSDPYFEEMKFLIDKWQGDSKELLTFGPMDTIMQIYYQKSPALPFSFSYVDGFSKELFQYILRRSRKVIENDFQEGKTVIVVKDLDKLNNLQLTLIQEINSQGSLSKIDETQNLIVYQFSKKSLNPSLEYLNLLNRVIPPRNALEPI